jgi:cytidine deaminase
VSLARAAAEGSYAPYSKFRVGAVVVAEDGTEYSGANVENAAYGSTICAEATAIAGAVAKGVRKISTLVVACVDAGDVDGAYPCGNCRQIMNEFGVEHVIVTAGEGAEVREHTLGEIHPFGFFLD